MPKSAEKGTALLPALRDRRDRRAVVAGRDSRDRRDRRGFPGGRTDPLGRVERFLADYMVLPGRVPLVISTWVGAAWLAELWDRFPHLAIKSPEKRCGKTTLLDLLFQIVPRPRYTTNISPAALYRVIEKEHPTLLMDESQSLARRGSESSEVTREILNAGIGKNAKVTRCAGERMEDIVEFSVYSPKVFALIGEPDSVLADRCLAVPLTRKTNSDSVKRYRSREVEETGGAIRGELEAWAQTHQDKIEKAYAQVEPFEIENDRMADLLMPLQAILTVVAPDELGTLKEYAVELDSKDREAESMTPGVQILAACRELFSEAKKGNQAWISTRKLIDRLVERTEEPWGSFTRGGPITPEALARLLKPYGIRSERDVKQSGRGYVWVRFNDAWDRYLSPSPEKASDASRSSRSSAGGAR